MFGPVLRGERVRLAPPIEDYLPHYCRWFADLEVTRYLILRNPPSPGMEREWLDRVARSETDVVWAILVGDRLIGNTGIHAIDWRNRHASTGIMLGEKAEWGKGYATEVMRLRTRYAFRELGLEKLSSSALMDNEGSKRALMRAGYRQYGVSRRDQYRDGRWQDLWLCDVLREEWQAAEGSGT
jgi:RimJ/RimL family protein N-acetyltransferase